MLDPQSGPGRAFAGLEHRRLPVSTPASDATVVALWLGHENIETTQIYLHASMKAKEAALARTTPTGTTAGRYKPDDDTLLAFLQAL